MPPDLAAAPARQGWLAAIPDPWRGPLARLAIAWLGLLAVFAPDWHEMAGQWWDSSTYNHILLIPFILGWLVSLRWAQLRQLAPQAWWPGLVPFAGAAFLWLLGSFAGLSQACQLGVVVMAMSSVLVLLGPRVSAGLAFPLFYMLFMVPFGDELVPMLQTVTARLTMILLAWTELPATIDGVFITTPTGYFEVAEACSGVKFLIAMIAYGALVANVCFRSWPRRAAFTAVCAVLPILANGVRAWGTIFIAHYRGIEFAASFDHVFYGWVFFAVVMGLVMLVSYKFFDRAVDDPMIDAAAIERSPLLAGLARRGMPEMPAIAALAGITALMLGWSLAASGISAPLPKQVFLPAVPGWQQIDYRPAHWWQPRHGGADHRVLGRYVDGKGGVVDVSYALYAAQEDGREAGGFGEGALTPGSGWSWVGPGAPVASGKSELLQAAGPVNRLAVTWYRTGNLLTASNLRLKLANIGDRVLLRARPTGALILSAEDRPAQPADRSIENFIAASGPVDRWMDRLAAGR